MASLPGAASRPLRTLFFLDYDDGFGGRFTNSPGLLPLLGHARSAGFEVTFIDAEPRLLTALEDRSVDVVAISSMERLLPRSIHTAQRVRDGKASAMVSAGAVGAASMMSSLSGVAPKLVRRVYDICRTEKYFDARAPQQRQHHAQAAPARREPHGQQAPRPAHQPPRAQHAPSRTHRGGGRHYGPSRGRGNATRARG